MTLVKATTRTVVSALLLRPACLSFAALDGDGGALLRYWCSRSRLLEAGDHAGVDYWWEDYGLGGPGEGRYKLECTTNASHNAHPSAGWCDVHAVVFSSKQQNQANG